MHLRLRFQSLAGLAIVAMLHAGCAERSERDAAAADNLPPRPQLIIAAAASLTDVAQQAGSAFAAQHRVELVYNFASSGALAQQILAAPRADVFISASAFWMTEVEQAGRLMEGTRRPLLSNALTVIAHPKSDYTLETASALPGVPFSLLALGDPAFVPVGRYARAYLESVDSASGGSVWAGVAERVSPAIDARAVVAQVASRQDVIGIVYRTDARARAGAVRELLAISPSEGPAIHFPVAALRSARDPELARAFIDFLGGEEARAIFEAAGFIALPREER